MAIYQRQSTVVEARRPEGQKKKIDSDPADTPPLNWLRDSTPREHSKKETARISRPSQDGVPDSVCSMP
jgi:hypothetical protein